MSQIKEILVGLDVGTTNIKAAAYDLDGRLLSHASLGITTASPQPGWAEQDAFEIVALSQRVIRKVVASATTGAATIVSLGMANHTETLIVWNRETGDPMLPAILWSCRRGADEILHLDTSETRVLIKTRTGLDLDATFTAAKLAWVCSNHPDIADGLRHGTMLFGTVDTWLAWSFTNGRVYSTEAGNASRTMLFDINSLQFDPELMALFGLKISAMPEIRRTNAFFGNTDANLLGAEFPIHALAGDQQASLFGHGCLKTGQTKITFGTGAFVWANAGTGARPEAPEHGIVETIAWNFAEPTYAYEGFVTNAGRALTWLSDHLAVEGSIEGLADAAKKTGTSNGVQIVPAFQGLSAPWWQSDCQAAILGITSATEVGHIAHAGFEAVAHQVRTLLDLFPDSPDAQAADIRVDGGLRHSAFFVQLQADILQVPLYVSEESFLSAKGAALMAGLGVGVWKEVSEISSLQKDNGASGVWPDQANWAEESHAQWLSVVEAVIKFNNLGAHSHER